MINTLVVALQAPHFPTKSHITHLLLVTHAVYSHEVAVLLLLIVNNRLADRDPLPLLLVALAHHLPRVALSNLS